jgi:hypothetical protein
MTHFMMENSYQIMFLVNIIPFGLIHVHIKKMESEVKYGDKTMTNSISHGKLKDKIHGCMDSKS